MNKKRVDGWMLLAKEAIDAVGISKNGNVPKAFRGQISSFGAAVIMGSFKSAVAFFSEQGGAAVEREKLIRAMYYVAVEKDTKKSPREIFEYVCVHDSKELRDKFTDASIAIKLALNFYNLES